MRKLRAETLNTLPGILASKRERSYGHTSASGKSGRQISTKMLPKDSFTLDWSVGLTARARELGSQQKLLSFSQPSLSPQLPSTPLVLPLLFSPWLYSLQRPLLERRSTKENKAPVTAFLWVQGLQSGRSWGGRPSLCASGLPTLAQWRLLHARTRGEGARGPQPHLRTGACVYAGS